MFCPACGNQVTDDSAACPVCGNDLSGARQVTQAMPPTQPMPVPPPAPVPPPEQVTAPMPVGPPPGSYTPAAPTVASGAYAPVASAPAKRPLTGLIVGVTIAVILLVVVVVGLGGFAAYSFLNGHIPGLGGKGASVAISAATPATAGAAIGAPTPDAAVDAWFVAVSQGDLAAVKKTATPDFASNIDASMFEGRDAHESYRIDNIDIQGDSATVDVQESPTDAPAQTATTFTVLKQTDGTWLVSQYVVAATGETPGADAATPVEPATQTPAFDKTDAIDVVGTMLSGLKGTGSLSAAKAAATSRFKSANPGWIMKSSDYDFYVTGAKKQGDAWIVIVKEQWQSGAETASYTVIVKDGKGYVDRRHGLN